MLLNTVSMKLPTFLLFAIGSLRLLGCAAEPEGTTVSGSVQLTRQNGSETGQTGFAFPDRTRIDESPFFGSCSFDDASGAPVLLLTVERAATDPFGLSSFSLELPIDNSLEPGAAKVTAVAGGTVFEDASGSCTAQWSGYDAWAGAIDVYLDCSALAGADSAESVGLSASLSLDGCD